MRRRGKIGPMRALRAIVSLTLLAVASACAPKVAPLPVAGPAQFPEFIQPQAPGSLASTPLARQNERAWLFMQAGELRTAEREASVALKANPDFFPAQATAAYIALAKHDAKGAAAQFTKIAEAHPDYVPALVGKGLALVAADRSGEAAEAFKAALRVDPSLTDVARRVEVMTLRGLQDELAAARQAARNGQPDAAMRAYRNAIAASPDSAFLYRELAAIERQQGEVQAAIEHLRQAGDLDPSDPGVPVMLGDILDQQGDLEGALKAYSAALDLEPDPAVEDKRVAVRSKLEFAALPEQYRAIESTPQAARADLAALIAVRLPSLVQSAPVRDVSVLTDVRGHWAERYITPVARAGIVEAFPNHTFQPRTLLRRVDLAQAAARLLTLLASAQPSRAQAWLGARGRFSDMNTGHLAYPAASMAVAAGVMQPTADGAFQPTRVVTGAEAVAAIERLRALALPALTTVSDRR
jgi:tetratricopeptide (TPR) repeat protein